MRGLGLARACICPPARSMPARARRVALLWGGRRRGVPQALVAGIPLPQYAQELFVPGPCIAYAVCQSVTSMSDLEYIPIRRLRGSFDGILSATIRPETLANGRAVSPSTAACMCAT